MILFNITVNLETSIHAEWLDWMRKDYLPALMETGNFKACKLCRLIDPPNEGVTYSIQCFCDTLENYKAYKEAHGDRFYRIQAARFPEKQVSFESLMEIIEEY